MSDAVAIPPSGTETETTTNAETTTTTTTTTAGNKRKHDDSSTSLPSPALTAPTSPTVIVQQQQQPPPLGNAAVLTPSGASSNNSTESATDVSSTTPLMDKVREFLDNESITYQAHPPREESAVVSMNLTGKNGSYRTFVEARQGQKRVLVYVESPVKVPVMRRGVAAEFLMRVNYSLALGNFELDFRDGEVRYRNGIDVDGGVLSLEMIRQLIMVPASTMDRFFGGMMQVIYGTTLPAEAYEECRNTTPGQAPTPSGSSQ